MKKIYIAGPDIFAPDGVQIGERYKMLCEKYGFQGIYPLDGSSVTASADITPNKVFYSCLASIQGADVVVVNLNPFRGECVDDGTAFEVGVAFRMEKMIYGYMSDARSVIDRHGGKTIDAHGWNYEDFGHPVNLMLAEACDLIVEGDFEDCLEAIAAHRTKPYEGNPTPALRQNHPHGEAPDETEPLASPYETK